jgi:hypothetical protein
MKLTLTFLLLFVTFGSYASESELSHEECGQIYVGVNNAGGKLNGQETSKFLNSISCGYFSTAEGGEFGGELIMIVLENSPKEFISAFDKLSSSLQEVILGEIKAPIHDGFDLQNIYNYVTNVKTKSPTKTKILSAIKQAAKGQGGNVK